MPVELQSDLRAALEKQGRRFPSTPDFTADDEIDVFVADVDAARVGGTIRVFTGEADPTVYNDPRVTESLLRAKRPEEMLVAHSNRGAAMVLEGRFEDALYDYVYCEMLARKLGFTPDEVATYPDDKRQALQEFLGNNFNNHGFSLMQLGRAEEALPKLHTALEFNPAQVFANNNIGDCIRSLGYPRQSIPYYQRELVVNPSHPTAQSSLGDLALHL